MSKSLAAARPLALYFLGLWAKGSEAPVAQFITRLLKVIQK